LKFYLQQTSQGFGGCLGILLTTDGGDHGNSVGPGPQNLKGILCGDAADGNNRQGDFRGDLFQEVKPTGRSGVFLGGRGVNRAKTNIIRPLQKTFPGLLQGAGRTADYGLGSQESSGQRDREILLTQMNPVGLSGQGHVYAVIDDKGHAGPSAEGLYLPGPMNQFFRSPGLLTKLDGIGPAGNSQFGQFPMGETGLQEDIG
jgi:hypothetical protein